MISFALEEDQQIVREMARKFAAEAIRPNLRKWEHAGCVPAEAQEAFAALGLYALEQADEGGLSQATTQALVHEELAHGDAGAAVALWAPHTAALALRELADPEPGGQYEHLQRVLSGAGVRGSVAYSERTPSLSAHGAGFSTVAVPRKDGYVLSGRKSLVINAGLADVTVVFAQINPDAGWDGIGAFAVLGRPGVRQGLGAGPRHGLLGLETVTAADLLLDECFVREEDRLRGGGNLSAAVQRFLARAQLVNAARQIGLARAAYEVALEYTQERRAFGKPIAHFQAVSFMLADMLMDVESARWMLWRAAADAGRGRLDPSLCAQAAVHASEAAWRVADNAVQLLGGAGYIQDFPVEKWLRDTRALSLFSGVETQHRELIAESELGLPPPSLPGAAMQPLIV